MEWMNLPKEPAIVARQVVWVKMRSHPWWPAQVHTCVRPMVVLRLVVVVVEKCCTVSKRVAVVGSGTGTGGGGEVWYCTVSKRVSIHASCRVGPAGVAVFASCDGCLAHDPTFHRSCRVCGAALCCADDAGVPAERAEGDARRDDRGEGPTRLRGFLQDRRERLRSRGTGKTGLGSPGLG